MHLNIFILENSTLGFFKVWKVTNIQTSENGFAHEQVSQIGEGLSLCYAMAKGVRHNGQKLILQNLLRASTSNDINLFNQLSYFESKIIIWQFGETLNLAVDKCPKYNIKCS
jgi:hypothetical protein